MQRFAFALSLTAIALLLTAIRAQAQAQVRSQEPKRHVRTLQQASSSSSSGSSSSSHSASIGGQGLAPHCENQTICSLEYAPVCGSDAAFYMNDCVLRQAACTHTTLTRASNDSLCIRNLPTKPRIVAIGDSLTEYGANPEIDGWVSMLQHTYVRAADVVNRGLGGYNTKWLVQHVLPNLLQDVKTLEPVLMTLWLGTNDAAVDSTQSVPLEEYRANLKTILTQLKRAAPQAQVVVITPSTVKDAARNANAKLYAEAAVEIASEHASGSGNVVDLYTYFMQTYPDRSKRDKLLYDGLHLNTEGNHLVFAQIDAKIRALLPTQVLFTWQNPDWQQWVESSTETASADANTKASDSLGNTAMARAAWAWSLVAAVVVTLVL